MCQSTSSRSTLPPSNRSLPLHSNSHKYLYSLACWLNSTLPFESACLTHSLLILYRFSPVLPLRSDRLITIHLFYSPPSPLVLFDMKYSKWSMSSFLMGRTATFSRSRQKNQRIKGSLISHPILNSFVLSHNSKMFLRNIMKKITKAHHLNKKKLSPKWKNAMHIVIQLWLLGPIDFNPKIRTSERANKIFKQLSTLSTLSSFRK